MKYFIDGDQMVFTREDFVNLQESPAVFYPLESEVAQAILASEGVPFSDLWKIKVRLRKDMTDAAKTRPCSSCGNPIPDSGVFGLPTYTDVPENHKEDCPIREIMEERNAPMSDDVLVQELIEAAHDVLVFQMGWDLGTRRECEQAREEREALRKATLLRLA